MDLFDHQAAQRRQTQAPLADRMRPRTLDEYVGQEHIIAPGRLLRRAIALDQISSLIFYGPPGTGKTTLARIIANTTESYFVSLNAVLAGIKDIREAIAKAQAEFKYYQKSTLLFVDEVHRFNKSQQDALLPWVENGTVILIGATTENPYFEVNKALVSRSRIFQLTSLESRHLEQVLAQTLDDNARGYGELQVTIETAAKDHLIQVSNGDARTLLNALELAVETTEPKLDGRILITLAIAEDSIQQRAVLYDKEGDAHFDTISAFIKSVRGSDPDAALYWLAKMLYAGEEPRYIFRRLLILACEDIGLADPSAVTIVNSCAETFDRIGMPEGRYPLAQATLYLATTDKSNSVMGFFDAIATVEKEQVADVPNHLKDPNRDKEEFGHGADYQYPHAYREHWVEQQYLPDFLQGKQFYDPSSQGYEKQIKDRVLRRREAQLAAFSGGMNDHRLDILTYGKTDAVTERWLQRTLSKTGQQLGKIRDRLFADITIQRHDIVLDLNAGNGLLTWEALRQTPEGGVYSVVTSINDDNNLNGQAISLDELQRPKIIRGELTELTDCLNPDIQFDKIIGRNVLMASSEKKAIAQQLKQLLQPQTQLRIVETIPREGQRLYQLLDLKNLAADIQKKLIAAEEAIYTNPNDDMVNWDDNDLQKLFKKLGLETNLQKEIQTTQIFISPQLLKRWFTSQKPQRPSYIDHLHAKLDDAEIQLIQHQFERQLLNKAVPWQSTILWITASGS
ncbi:Recombination protein MgsA [[Leptolyngbya] sp. PCC 7376]|uniref:AAA family ATPase n=1 Tax=[Leptolyngbya] sp. PCC 7376 TaxID=111781 RepID=UPI00029F300A|nr:AAA family ATPase [[Leptolyngbya] sp. PCC 7376]AFY38387.1 Recombination protein MgsA [[Leptolyngbya] sp. PCC 7376]